MGMEYIQLRPHWRWHERKEGSYTWDDIDRIFKLADKIGVKIIFKFMLECGPEYLFKKYNAYRIGLKGENIWPITHGAFYPGGWIPCFDNPHVTERMKLFITEAVNRYKNESALAIWHAWNEPRSRPMGECTCEHSHKSYINWLRNRFGTIETLNMKYGQCWADFEDINVPRNTSGLFDMHLWRQWAASRVAWRVKEVAETIRQSDPSRGVIAHVGMPSPVQDVLNDTSDDWLTRREVAFYGSSFEIRYTPKPLDKSWPFMIADWNRAISGDGYFWINELYPSRARWQPELSPETIISWAWSAVACGAKGIVLWQYRKERVGCETNEAGLVEMDGKENATSKAMRQFFKIVNDNQKLFRNAKVPQAQVAIVYDFNSDLISRIEESNHEGNLELTNDLSASYIYKTALQGIYHLFWETGIQVDFISSHELEKINDYKLVYLPLMVMVDEKQEKILADYVYSGGQLLAESGTAMREGNTWANTSRPGNLLADVFGLKEIDRIVSADEVKHVELPAIGSAKSKFMNATFETKSAKVLAGFSDGSPAICTNNYGRGKTIMTGFSAGLANLLTGDRKWAQWLCSMLESTRIDVQQPTQGIYVRKMVSESNNVFFIFNTTNKLQQWTCSTHGTDIINNIQYKENDILELKAFEIRIFLYPNKNC